MKIKKILLYLEAAISFFPLLIFFSFALFVAPEAIVTSLLGPHKIDALLAVVVVLGATLGLYGFYQLLGYVLFEPAASKRVLVKSYLFAAVGAVAAIWFGVLIYSSSTGLGLPWLVLLPIVVTIHFAVLAYRRFLKR